VWLDPEGRMLPSSPLQGIDLDAEGHRAVLTLRPGLTWHSHPDLPGGEAGADDLRFSLQAAVRAGQLTLPPFETETIGARQLRLSCDRPLGALAQRLASVVLVPAALPTVEDLDDMRQPVGIGPFRLVPDASDSVTLEAHADYWRSTPEAPIPGVDHLRVHTLSEQDSWRDALDAVASGTIDLAPLSGQPDEDEVRARAAELGVQIAVRETPEAHWLCVLAWFRGGPAGLSAADRRAIHHGLDRSPLARSGSTLSPTRRFLPPTAIGYDPTWTPPLLPPAELRASRPLLLGVHPTEAPLGDALVDALGTLGLEARWVELSDSAAADQLEAPTLDGAVFHLPKDLWGKDPTPWLGMAVRGMAAFGPECPDLVDLLARVEEAITHRARARAIRALTARLHDEVPAMPLLAHPAVRVLWALSPRVVGLHDPATGRVHRSALGHWSGLSLRGG
jgi:ABC-type transport system substrate-binding protein